MRTRRPHASLPLWRGASQRGPRREVELDPGKLADRPDLSSGDAAAVLRWWLEAGVQFAIDETPRDHFAPAERATPAPPSPALPVRAPVERPVLPGHRASEADRSPA